MSKVKNNPFEELFKKIGEEIAAKSKELAIGTVSSVSAGGISVSVDGDQQGTKNYTCNRTTAFKQGDRVLLGRVSGTWAVICKIGSPGGPTAKTTDMTQAVGVDDNGALWTEPTQGGGGESYTLPVATTSTLGGVKASAAYAATTHTVKIAADSNGVLYAEKPSAYNLPTATTAALGGIKTAETYNSTKHTLKTAVNASGVLYAEAPAAYTLPKATSTTLGGVQPVAKTTQMTQAVGVDSNGKLYTVPGAGAYSLPTASTTELGGVKTSEAYSSTKHTLKVAVNSSGQLYAEAPGSVYATELATSATSDYYNVKLNTNRQLVPSHNSSSTKFSLGTASYPWGDAYLGYYGTVMICNNSSYDAKLGFFGHTANGKQTLSLTSQNMGYTSVTASNYLTALNNLIGILKEKHGLIG